MKRHRQDKDNFRSRQREREGEEGGGERERERERERSTCKIDAHTSAKRQVGNKLHATTRARFNESA